MSEYLALFAVLLAVAAIVGYGLVHERRLQEITRRLDRLERSSPDRGTEPGPSAQPAVGPSGPGTGPTSPAHASDDLIEEVRDRVDALDDDLRRRWAELLYQQSVGARQPIRLHLPARVWAADAAQAEPVRQALVRLADGLGFEVAYAYPAAAAADRTDPGPPQRLILARRVAADGLPAQRADDPRDEIRAALSGSSTDEPDDASLEFAALVSQAGRCVVQLGPGVLASDGRRVVYAELTAAQVRELDRDRGALADPGRLVDRADRTVDLTDRVRATVERTTQGLRRREEAVAARERELDEQAETVRQRRADLDAEADRIAQQIEAVRTAFEGQVQEFADQRAAMEHAAYLQAKGANAEIAQLRAEIERLERRIGAATRQGGAGAEPEPDPLPRREPGRYGPGLT